MIEFLQAPGARAANPDPTSRGFRPRHTCRGSRRHGIAFMISTTVSPRTGSSFCPQSCSESAPHIVAADRLIIRQEHRDQAGVRGALHVVLAPQRIASRCRGRPTWPVISASAIRQRALSVPWTCWLMPHAPEDDRGFRTRGRCGRPHANVSAADAADRRHLLGREVDDLGLQLLIALGIARDILLGRSALP